MSRSLEWRIPPSVPETLGVVSTDFKHLLLAGLNMGDAFEQITEATLDDQPALVLRGGHVEAYLQGVADVADPELRDEVLEFLQALNLRGALQIGVHS